jgi:hypothetical protein
MKFDVSNFNSGGVQAIKASSCYVDDITKATAVFVYDYCYYIWWLAHIHSALGKKVVDTPGDYLIEVRPPCSPPAADLPTFRMSQK